MKCPRLLLLFAGMLQIGFNTARADVLDNWTTNQISTNSFCLKHVVYGNGCYVAVGEYGDSGGIYSSTDGFSWTLRYTEPNSWGLSLEYSGGRFICSRGWDTVVSTDGTNWLSSISGFGYHPNNGSISEIICAKPSSTDVFVGVGSTNGIGYIITSANGSNWTARSISPAPGGHIASVTYGASKFVAVGNNDGFEYTSSTGSTWTRSSIPGGSQISYANGLFFVPLNSKTNLVSWDGFNWNQYGTGLTNQLGKIIYANGLFLARSGNYLVTSSDGIKSWVQYSQPIPGGEVATDGKRLVTVGYTGSFYYNGFTFTSEVLAGVRMTNNLLPTVALSGLVGRIYLIQSADTLNGIWSTRKTLQLPTTPYVWTDPTATNSARFYRSVLLP